METCLEQILSTVHKIEGKFNCIEKSLKRIEFEQGLERKKLQEQKQSNASIRAQLHIIQQMISRLDEVNSYRQMFQSQMNKHAASTSGANTDRTRVHGDQSIHRDVLKKHVEDFVNDVDLKETFLIDRLTANSVLSEGESSELRADQNRRNQNRKLVCKMSQRSSAKFKTFLDLLKIAYPHIHGKLTKSYDEMAQVPRPELCTICIIKRDVDLLNIADKLFKRDLINLEIYNMLCSNPNISAGPPQKHLWECVLNMIDESKDRQTKVCDLIEILNSKYDHCSAQLSKWSCQTELRCWCSTEDPHQSITSDSSFNKRNDKSTTKRETMKSRITENHPIDNVSNHSTESESIVRSEEYVQYTNVPMVLKWLESVDESGFKENEDAVITNILTSESISKKGLANTRQNTSKTIALLSEEQGPVHENASQNVLTKDESLTYHGKNSTLSNGSDNFGRLSLIESETSVNRKQKTQQRQSRDETSIKSLCYSTELPKKRNRSCTSLVDNSGRNTEDMSSQDASSHSPMPKQLFDGNDRSSLHVRIHENNSVFAPSNCDTSSPSSPDKTISTTSSPDTNNNPNCVADVQLIMSPTKMGSLISGVRASSGKTLSRRQKRNEKRKMKNCDACKNGTAAHV